MRCAMTISVFFGTGGQGDHASGLEPAAFAAAEWSRLQKLAADACRSKKQAKGSHRT